MSSVYLGVELHEQISGLAIGIELYPLWPKALLVAGVVFISLVSTGLYQRWFRFALAGMLVRVGMAFLVAALTLVTISYFMPNLYMERDVFIISLLLSVVLVSATRVMFVHCLDQNILKRRLMVLGAGETAAQVARNLRRKTDQQGFTIVGYVHVVGEHDVVDEEKIIRTEGTLLAEAKDRQIDEIVVAVGERRCKNFPVHDLLDCKLSGIDVVDLLGFFERETGKIKLDILTPSGMIFSDGFNQAGKQVTSKRIFDVLVSLALLAVSWPVMLLVALAIFIESGCKGSILYRQIRVGQYWKLFSVYKFRSMREDAEKDGEAQWAKKNDDRITRVGRFARLTRLDELPQIFNVLKGDMSFVGPRPERPKFVTQLSERIPFYAERHYVKPGITGWAQICYPYGASEKDSLEKLQFDLYYIKNYSLFLDLVIIFQTAHAVLWGKGGR
ncbi:MAG: TIGR03013 family PEP-CTERM/XrtA system glycosyltransferase [Gammaproteobacteria bacterium]|nr:TIGR03013 family PEP-CTERM/XrtA system glycosyltransferase [Gammaproteobacteria bacterium]